MTFLIWQRPYDGQFVQPEFEIQVEAPEGREEKLIFFQFIESRKKHTGINAKLTLFRDFESI